MAVITDPVHPDEKAEIIERLEKRRASVKRAESTLARKHRELRAEVADAYPKIGVTLIREALDVTRQRVHQMLDEHAEETQEDES